MGVPGFGSGFAEQSGLGVNIESTLLVPSGEVHASVFRQSDVCILRCYARTCCVTACWPYVWFGSLSRPGKSCAGGLRLWRTVE